MDRDTISETNGIDQVNTTETKYVYYTEKRHTSTTVQNREEGSVQDWRMRERLKTVSGALILCLNIGVDPPDVVKPSPCACGSSLYPIKLLLVKLDATLLILILM